MKEREFRLIINKWLKDQGYVWHTPSGRLTDANGHDVDATYLVAEISEMLEALKADISK